LELGVAAEARKHAEILVRSNPERGDLQLMLAECLEAEGEYDAAAEVYANAITHDPHLTDAYVRMASLCFQRFNQVARAEEVMDRLVESNPESARAFLERGRYRLQRAFLDGADSDLKKAWALTPKDADVLAASALIAEVQGDDDQAATLWSSYATERPTDPVPYLRMAALRWEAKDDNQAVSTLQLGLSKLPNQPELLQCLGELYIGRGKLEHATTIIACLRAAAPTCLRADYLEGRRLMRQGALGKAVSVMEAIASTSNVSPDFAARVWETLGQCYAQLGDRDRQMTAYERAATLNPAAQSARLAYADSLTLVGRIDEALEHYSYLAGLPGARTENILAYARALLQRNLALPASQRDWRELDRVLEKAMAARSCPSRLLILQAEVLAARQQPNQARGLLSRARAPSPQDPLLLTAVADIAMSQGDTEKADRLWMAAQENPTREISMACAEFWGRWGGMRARSCLRSLEQDAPKHPGDWEQQLLRALAYAYFHLGHYTDTERVCKILFTRVPDDLRCRLLLIEIALVTGRESLARQLLPDIRRLEGEAGTWHRYAEAVCLTLRGDSASRAEARRALAELTRVRPNWSRALLLEARLDEIDGESSRALNGRLKAIELGELKPELVLQVSKGLAKEGRFLEADEIIRRLQQQATLSHDFMRYAAEIALHAGNPERALTLARQTVPPETSDYREHIWLGRLLSKTGRRIEAEQSFRRATELAGHAPDAWTALVGFLAGIEQSEAAEAVIAEAARVLPAESVKLTLAECEEALGRWEQAEQRFRGAIAERPEDFVVLRRAAEFYLRREQAQKAEPLLRLMVNPAIYVPESDFAWARRQLTALSKK
jgi:tetratricopeptide (TPR) repeat protein